MLIPHFITRLLPTLNIISLYIFLTVSSCTFYTKLAKFFLVAWLGRGVKEGIVEYIQPKIELLKYAQSLTTHLVCLCVSVPVYLCLCMCMCVCACLHAYIHVGADV